MSHTSIKEELLYISSLRAHLDEGKKQEKQIQEELREIQSKHDSTENAYYMKSSTKCDASVLMRFITRNRNELSERINKLSSLKDNTEKIEWEQSGSCARKETKPVIWQRMRMIDNLLSNRIVSVFDNCTRKRDRKPSNRPQIRTFSHTLMKNELPEERYPQTARNEQSNRHHSLVVEAMKFKNLNKTTQSDKSLHKGTRLFPKSRVKSSTKTK